MNKKEWKEFLDLFLGCLMSVGIMIPIFIVVQKLVSPTFFPFTPFTAVIILAFSLTHGLWKWVGEFYDNMRLESD